jgi:hypothetical protein
MTRERIEKAIEVINYAIENKTSVKEASVKCGHADTYVKNTKALVYYFHDNGGLDDELFDLFEEAYFKYLNNRNKDLDQVFSEEDIDKNDLNIKGTTCAESSFSEKNDNADFEWKGTSKIFSTDSTIKTIEDLLEACNVDTTEWDVKESTINKWDVSRVIDGEVVITENFQVKARLVKFKESQDLKAIGETLGDIIKNYEPPILNIPLKISNTDENNLLEISLFDLHMGKLCWGLETGENFNIKIAAQRFISVVTTLLQRASAFKYNRILFPIGNDFFNSDTIWNTTTHGTFQDEDTRYQKTFAAGIKLLVDSINLLKQTGVPIDILIIAGNHDFERSYYLGSVIEAWFNKDPQVTVNNNPSPRKYYRYGKVLLGFTHGSEEKESSLPMLMASDIESKPFWSETIFHEFHAGHIHRKRNVSYKVIDTREKTVNEDLGVTVRYLSSLTGTDAWHNKSGFIGAIKAGDAFVWNDELGLLAHLNANYNVEN